MKRKLLSGVLALVMLAGCTAPVPDTQKLPDADVEETRGAYVPLDDRPVNTDRVEYLAGSLGYELVMPDAEDYRTRLDEQPLGESGLKYGDRAALYEWVLEQEESGCDRYILSLDQLLSGGLVNSRCFMRPRTRSGSSIRSCALRRRSATTATRSRTTMPCASTLGSRARSLAATS